MTYLNSSTTDTLTPREIVRELDRYIVGQSEAKRAVAIALRNRERRRRLTPELQSEITPKNIIMVGPTGVGKTEIARRLARLVEAPFIKVEATKFTEVGYVGRDVESMIRDLVQAAIHMVKNSMLEKVKEPAAAIAEERLVALLVPANRGQKKQPSANPFDALALLTGGGQREQEPRLSPDEQQKLNTERDAVRQQLQRGQLEDRIIEIEVEEQQLQLDIPGLGPETGMQDMLSSFMPKKTKKRKVTIKEARKILENEEAQNLIDMDEVTRIALEKTEQEGIIFIDEIDKITGRSGGSGPDVSREGVQRDILPIVEGSTVNTKYGPVKTDFILFIAAGAFHVASVDDLIPELQGRFPIRVDLHSLTEEDFRNILFKPDNAVIKQYQALLATDKVHLSFTEDALDAIASFAYMANQTGEDIGARRLHTILETILEDISFNAGGDYPEFDMQIDSAYVHEQLKSIESTMDLKKHIL